MNPYEYKAVVESISDQELVLNLGNGRQVTWPRKNAPIVRKGDSVVVRLMTEEQATTDRHEQARAILKELLGGEQ